MIRLTDAGLRYDDQDWILRDVNLTLSAGGFVSVLGPSGCGKSTMLRMIAGLLPPSSGSVSINDHSASKHRREEGGLAFVFQEPRLLPWRDVLQNIGLPLELLRVASHEREAAVRATMQLVGLREEDAHKHPQMLSGGMRMRVSIARALVTQPDVLLLDEPFAALDDLLREQLNEELLRLWEERRPTSLFVTHNVHEAVFLSQRVVVIGERPGRVQHVFEVPFDYPRQRQLRRTPDFVSLTAAIGDAMRGGDE